MAKITRFTGNFKAFAADATADNRTIFGSASQADDLDANLNTEFFQGWEILPIGAKPPREWFNGYAFAMSQTLAYLHQMGVAEWDSLQEYHTGSVANKGGALWASLTDNNIGNDPETDGGVNWLISFLTPGNNLSDLDDVAAARGNLNLDRRTLLILTSGFSGSSKTLLWDSSPEDTDGFWSAGDPGRITVPSGVSKIKMTLSVSDDTGSVDQPSTIILKKNRSFFGESAAGQYTGRLAINIDYVSGFQASGQSAVIDVVPGDYFHVELTGDFVLEQYGTWFQIEVIE